MRNPKYWRKRTREQEQERLDKLRREAVFSSLNDTKNTLEKQDSTNRLRRLFGLSSIPTVRKKIRRLSRKFRRIENGTYKRQRN